MLYKDFLSKDNFICLKGLFALAVIASHIRSSLVSMNDTVIGQMLTVLGYLSVAMFFFFSGYGIAHQYKCKGELYIKKFPRNRLLDIYLKYLLVILIYFLYNIILSSPMKINRIITSFLFGGTIAINGWYLQAIIVSYVAFYLIVSFVKPKLFIPAFCVYLIAYIVLCLFLGLGILWYQSYLPFFVGIVCANKKEEIYAFLDSKKTFIISFLVSVFLFCVTLFLGNLRILPFVLTVMCKMFSSVFFVSTILLGTSFLSVRFCITRWLGKISFEIYVVHGLFIGIARKCTNNNLIYAMLIYVFSIIAATLLNKVFSFISKKIKV